MFTVYLREWSHTRNNWFVRSMPTFSGMKITSELSWRIGALRLEVALLIRNSASRREQNSFCLLFTRFYKNLEYHVVARCFFPFRSLFGYFESRRKRRTCQRNAKFQADKSRKRIAELFINELYAFRVYIESGKQKEYDVLFVTKCLNFCLPVCYAGYELKEGIKWLIQSLVSNKIDENV